MDKTAKQRNELFAEALTILEQPSTEKIALLYHLIYSLKHGDDYILTTLSEIKCFVAFIDNNLIDNKW